jgi:hypothetical protein
VDKLHLCEIRPDRLAEVKKLYKPARRRSTTTTSSATEHLSRLYLDHAKIEPLSDLPRLPEVRKNVMLEADRSRIVGKRTNSHPAGQERNI